MTVSPATNTTVRDRLVLRLRALMARTVANGCTEEEELVAARMVGKAIAQVDAMGGGAPPEQAEPSWAQAERESREYQTLLEKNTAESLLKAAVQELALNHINTVSPARKHSANEPTERVDIHELLEPHLGMMLAVGGTRMGRQILRRMVEELVYDGALPRFLEMKRGL